VNNREIERRMGEIAARLGGIAANLCRLGYRFERPEGALPGREMGTEQAIERIEREVGAVPYVLRVFWMQVGSVDFAGTREGWLGCEYPDPLIVYPPSVAIAELDEFQEDAEERLRCGSAYCIPIAPDAFHKANVSGGMWYNLSVPALEEDPLLNDEPHGTTLLSYLELAVEFGGFPGLQNCPGHTWPLEEILRGV
jgi:hypothetical protein